MSKLALLGGKPVFDKPLNRSEIVPPLTTPRPKAIARRRCVALTALIISSVFVTSIPAVSEENDQVVVETEAIKLLSSPQLVNEMAATLDKLEVFAANAVPSTPTVRDIVHELAFAAALGAANGDPDRPRLIQFFGPGRRWRGREVPGSRWLTDNPDNLYRFATIDAKTKYGLTAYCPRRAAAQYSFMIYDSYLGETGKFPVFEYPVSGLLDRDITKAADGHFTVSIDSDAANGRANHLQNSQRGKILLIRETFSDWAQQSPCTIKIRRVGGPPISPAIDEKQKSSMAVAYLRSGGEMLAQAKRRELETLDSMTNTLTAPIPRGGGWGFSSSGFYKIKPNEALLITLSPAGARYLGVQISSLWWVSLESIAGNGSLNNVQASANRDGSYTYVISMQDPGVRNWLDTRGWGDGWVVVRWQAFPETVTSITNAIQEVRVISLDKDLSALDGLSKMSPVERKRSYEIRASNHARRLAVYP